MTTWQAEVIGHRGFATSVKLQTKKTKEKEQDNSKNEMFGANWQVFKRMSYFCRENDALLIKPTKIGIRLKSLNVVASKKWAWNQ